MGHFYSRTQKKSTKGKAFLPRRIPCFFPSPLWWGVCIFFVHDFVRSLVEGPHSAAWSKIHFLSCKTKEFGLTLRVRSKKLFIKWLRKVNSSWIGLNSSGESWIISLSVDSYPVFESGEAEIAQDSSGSQKKNRAPMASILDRGIEDDILKHHAIIS